MLRTSFEVDFGEGAPYRARFPPLGSLTYDKRDAITREVAGKVIDLLLEETGAEGIHAVYGPGGYQRYPVQPSVQIELQGSEAAVRDFMDAVGYLLQQTEVWSARPDPYGGRMAFDIFELGSRTLDAPEVMERFWQRLLELGGESIVQGFQPLIARGLQDVPDGQPGFRLIQATPTRWSGEEIARFQEALQMVADEFELDVFFQDLMVELVTTGNNWTEARDGQGYLRGLGSRGRSALQGRLVGEYRRRVEEWLEEAYRRHAPDELDLHRRGANGDTGPGADESRGGVSPPNASVPPT